MGPLPNASSPAVSGALSTLRLRSVWYSTLDFHQTPPRGHTCSSPPRGALVSLVWVSSVRTPEDSHLLFCAHAGRTFPLRGRGPYAAGWEGNSRGDKFRVLERGVEQDLITRGTGAAPFVAGNLPADRQVRSSRPRKGNTPPPAPPAPLALLHAYVPLRLRASVFFK
jgi:hypothetical protein